MLAGLCLLLPLLGTRWPLSFFLGFGCIALPSAVRLKPDSSWKFKCATSETESQQEIIGLVGRINFYPLKFEYLSYSWSLHLQPFTFDSKALRILST